MYPILFTIAGIPVYSFSVFLILSFFVFSFVFWRRLRSLGISEERIFDLIYYGVINAFIISRIVFAVFHKNLFADSLLKVVTIWIQPGLSLYGALVGGMMTIIYLSRVYKIRIVTILDTLALALPLSFIVGEVGSLLDGTVVGKTSGVAWALRYVGHPGLRHPVQIYEIIALVILLFIVIGIHKKAHTRSWPYGITGLCYFFFYSIVFFSIEFFKESSVYWGVFTINQWVLVALFAETIGALYIRGGGREIIRPLIRRMLQRFFNRIEELYARISKRRT